VVRNLKSVGVNTATPRLDRDLDTIDLIFSV